MRSIFLIFFINSLQQQTTNNLTPYVTSAFEDHPLTAATAIVASLVAGIIKLPVAKIMNTFGRPQGFAFMLACAVLGSYGPGPRRRVSANAYQQASS